MRWARRPPLTEGSTMKLTTITMTSVDGVMQGPGDVDEDRRGGFERGGWSMAYFDADAQEFVAGLFRRADAFMLGRRTYDLWAPYWSAVPDTVSIAAALNARPKYVVSSTLTDPVWAGTTVLPGLAEVEGLKAAGDGELQVHGSGELIRALLAAGLVDEMILSVCPLILGQGARLFPATGPDAALTLLESRTTGAGVTIQRYRPSGRPVYRTAEPTPGV